MSSPTPDVATRTLVHVLDYFAACGELARADTPEEVSADVIARLELPTRWVRCAYCDGDGDGDHGPCPDCDGAEGAEVLDAVPRDLAHEMMHGYVAEVEVYRLVGDDAYGDESGAMIVDLLVEYGGPTTLLRAEVDANGRVTTAEVRTSRHEQPGRSSSPMARAQTTTSRQDDAVQDALALLGVLS